MDNPIYIMMPVKCIGRLCKDCPNLHIDTSVSELFGNGESVGYAVNLQCRGVNRCLRLKQMMEDEYEEHNRQSEEP